MEFLQGEAFEGLFRAPIRRAFHLEVQDSYHTPEESGPIHRFLAGERDDLAWFRPWLELVREFTESGGRMQRVRVVTVPHVDYTRWGLSIAPHNIAAGEDIRWLPRGQVDAAVLPLDDFWLLDDDRVVFTVFEPSGRFAGGASTVDPSIVRRCLAVREQLWEMAVPDADYRVREHVSA